VHRATAALDDGALFLLIDALSLRGKARLCWPAHLWRPQRLSHQFHQPLDCVIAIARLRPKALRLNDKNAASRRVPATSKRNSTALDTLLTFCPPGPEARTNCHCRSFSDNAILSVMAIKG
jgi:hypothetical protein